jgi:hypothetical protein
MKKWVFLVGAFVAAANVGGALGGGAPLSGGRDLTPRLYKNCTNFNNRYPHGVGRRTARDKTSGTPVTSFTRSTVLYNRAMRYNRDLDRDRDGIACEQA